MNLNNSYKLAKKIVQENSWEDIIHQFIKVLKVNIFIVDSLGKVVLPPINNKYGGQLLTNSSLGYDPICGSPDYINNFEENGNYLEAASSYRLHMYAIPIKKKNYVEPLAYVVVGPVVINKKLDSSQYKGLASIAKKDEELLGDQFHEIRVVSNIMIRSILDLISTAVNKNASVSALSPVEPKLEKVREEGILNSFLDAALKMTDTECGSIMLLDETKNDLAVKFSRGVNLSKFTNVRIPVGEGISGIAAENNSSFILGNDETDSRINHLLKRPEIKQALVMPLVAKNRVFGVLNLHTKKQDNRNHFNMGTLKSLSSLLSAAL